MSETLIPENNVVDDGNEPSSRRNLVVVLVAVVALAVVGLAAYFLFLSGSSEDDFAPIPSAAGQAGGDKDQAKADGKKDEAKAEQAEQAAADDKNLITVGRDPFEPLSVEELKAQPEPTDPAADANQPAGNGAPVQTPAPTPTQDTDSYTVTLISVNDKKGEATIEVDGKRYVVFEKDMFPSATVGPFKLISVGEKKSGKGTASVAFGSASTVQLAEGDPIEFTV